MEYTSKTRKLMELRAKTDRELSVLIASLIDRGLFEDAEPLIPLLHGAERQLLESRIHREKPSRCKTVYAA
jgi:hypothetical protein